MVVFCLHIASHIASQNVNELVQREMTLSIQTGHEQDKFVLEDNWSMKHIQLMYETAN